MRAINTATGSITTDDLGRTLMHEHVMIGFPGWHFDNRLPKFQREDALSRVVDAFQALHDHGVRSVVDPCPMDLGRDVEFCAEVSQRSGIALICATGVYTESMGIPFTFRWMEEEAVAEIFIREIEDGIGHTGIRAGVIKIATGLGTVTDYERKMLRAAARAAKATGLSILSHTEDCSCGHDQIDIITGAGIAPERLIVGHSDGRDDHPYQSSLAERGVYVGFDRFGIETRVSDEVRIRNLVQMLDAGHRDRLIVSHDTATCFLGMVPGLGDPSQLKAIYPNHRLTRLFEDIFPQLKALGVSQDDLDRIVIDNPRAFFTGEAPRSAGAH